MTGTLTMESVNTAARTAIAPEKTTRAAVLDLLSRLKRKYAPTVAEIITLGSDLEQQLSEQLISSEFD